MILQQHATVHHATDATDAAADGTDDDLSEVLRRKPEDAPPPDSTAVRCLRCCGVRLLWGGDTDHSLVVRDAASGGALRGTRLLAVVVAVALSDLLFAMDSVPVVLSLSSSPLVLLASQVASLLTLRPLLFLLAALAAVIDSMQETLAVVLVLIALKILVEAAGYEVPLLGFVGALLAWRVLALCWAVHRRGRAAARTLVHARDPLAAPTQLTQLLAEEPTEGDGEGACAHPLARGSRESGRLGAVR